MTEIERIRAQIERAFTDKAWYGPALLEVIDGLDAATAAAHPIPGAHSIWEIVLHLGYGQDIVKRRIQGESVGWDLTRDWPAVEQVTEQAWQAAVEQLKRGEEDLLRAVTSFPVDRLDEAAMEGASIYNNLQGYAQHHAYHAGQIVILRRAAGKPFINR